MFSPTDKNIFVAVTAVTVTEKKKTALAGGIVSGKLTLTLSLCAYSFFIFNLDSIFK